MSEKVKIILRKNNLTISDVCLVILILSGILFIDSSTGSAQTLTSLSVLPAEAAVTLVTGDTVTVELFVTSAVEMNAFDLTLTYDPGLVQLDTWAYGPMLSNLFPMVEDNRPGILRVAATQMAQPAVNGDGVLLTLTFSGAAVGQSPVTLDSAVFVDKLGLQTAPALAHGVINVHYPMHTLSGRVTLQGQTVYEGIPVELGLGASYGYGPYSGITGPETTANLTLEGVVEDTYLFTTQQPRYLNIHAGMNRSLELTSDHILPDLHLMGGNAVWSDNVIDISDASVVGAMYELTLADLLEGEALAGDVNFDGLVNIQDLAMVAGNFDLTSEDAYAAWTP